METENKQDSTNLQQPQPRSQVVVRELSTAQQGAWIEKLFSRLLTIYGDRFTTLWTHSSAAEMKIVWADALGGFSGETLSLALKACYKEPYCPNLPQFVLLCRQNMQGQTPIKADETPLSKDQAAKILKEAQARMPERLSDKVASTNWAKNIIDLWDKKQYDCDYGYRLAREALGMKAA